MFKFNFSVKNNDENVGIIESKDSFESKIADDNEQKIEWFDCEEIVPDPEKHLSNIDLYESISTFLSLADKKLYYVHCQKQIELFSELVKEIKHANTSHSDLVTAEYEGGAKIWECTDDLLNYMVNSKLTDNITQKLVLDLGCGAGLLGIFASLYEAIVHFQDYNKDVLDIITIPNFLLNLPSSNNIEIKDLKAKFFSGDWLKYCKATENSSKFDLILTSETIYNPHNQNKLINTFAEKLKPDGSVLVAAKTYYFGVGGSLREFENLIEKDGRFASKIVWKSEDGICREILELKFKS